MTVVEYIRSRIDRFTDKRIKFIDGSNCPKSAGDLVKWSQKNFTSFFKDGDIREEASKGPDHIESEIIKGFKEIIKGRVYDIPTFVEDEEELVPQEKTDKYLEGLVPVIDTEARDKKNMFLMIDTNRGNRISPTSYISWEIGQESEYVKVVISQARQVRLRYLPTTTKSFLFPKEGDIDIQVLNTYYPPKHRLEKISKPVIPRIISDFLRELFVSKECFEFMMCSVWYMLNDRLQVIPVLNGGTGIGKGLFTEYLLGGLVGEGNSILAPASWDKSGFNAWLLKKQLIVFDEAKIISSGPDANVDYLKRLMNDSLNVERKGIDADKLTENHASFFITSNNGAKRFRLELDNRRFSPIDVTDRKVEAIYNKKDRGYLVELLQDEDVIANIYWEIQLNWNPNKRCPERTPHTIHQCEALYKFQYESLNIWQTAIAELILSREEDEYGFGEINAQYRKVYTQVTGKETNSKRSVNKADVKDFLQSYRYYGSDKPMGHVRQAKDGEMFIVAAEQYKSQHSGYKEVGLDAL